MKCQLTSQEKLKDLRHERNLTLVQVAEATGISKSTIGNYESDDFKEQQLTILTELADFYDVSLAYLIGLTDNLKEETTAISELHLDDDTVEILKSQRFNNRLLCEIIKHPSFANLMSDIEIYVDNLAGNWIHNLNRYVSYVRDKIKSLIDDDNYFGDLIENDIKTIAKDIRNEHKKDWDTGDDEQFTDKLFDQMDELIEAYKNNNASIEDIMAQDDFPKNDGMTTLEKAEVTRISNILDMNLTKLSANEVQVLMYLVKKSSKNPIFRQPTNGRRKK